MKRLLFLMLALLVAGSSGAATKVQVMTAGVIDVDRLPTISFFQETDPASPELGQIWWNNATNQLKVAGALGVYAFNATSLVEWDTTPEAFSFTDVTNATTNSTYVSDPITVSGINWPTPISVSGDASAKYSVNNATATAVNGTVASGDEVRAIVTSSASGGTAVNATVTVGGVSDAFGVTTITGESGGGEVACSGTFTSGDNESFESGVNATCTTGITLTGLATALDTYSADWYNCGAHSLKLESSTATKAVYVDLGSGITEKYYRFYLNPGAVASIGTYSTFEFFAIDGNTTGGHRSVAVGVRRGNTTQYYLSLIGLSYVAISPTEPLLIEGRIVFNSGTSSTEVTHRVKKYTGGTWVTLVDDQVVTVSSIGLSPRYMNLYATVANVPIYLDDIAIGSAWVGAQLCE